MLWKLVDMFDKGIEFINKVFGSKLCWWIIWGFFIAYFTFAFLILYYNLIPEIVDS